ncbi:hypothetical protein D3C72_2217410 [compost metagenome]
MKKPGPWVGICLTVFQVRMSRMLTSHSLRLGVAITGRPSQSQVIPEPRCGMPGRSMLATFLPEFRSMTWPW